MGRIIFLFSCAWLVVCKGVEVRAQTSASWQFPVDDGLTVNYIDTVILQWTSNFASPLLYMWCQNGTPGNNVVLGSQFQVQNSGKLGYVMNTDDPTQVDFPVACHAQLVPTANGPGVDSPVGITFTSQPNVVAKTVSLSSTISSSAAPSSSSASSVNTPSTIPGSISTSLVASSGTTIHTSSQSSATTTPPTSALTNETSSGTPSSTSGSASLPTTDPSSKASGNSNLGAIVGGALGGAALLCFIIFGVLFLRKYNRRDSPETTGRKSVRKTWWSGIPGMTRTSVYEVDGMQTARYEKEGTLPMHEKEASTKYPPVELG